MSYFQFMGVTNHKFNTKVKQEADSPTKVEVKVEKERYTLKEAFENADTEPDDSQD